jgi:hypothetical protein
LPGTSSSASDGKLSLALFAPHSHASTDEILDALARMRRLSDKVYEVCDAFRDGRFGEGTSARVAALQELADGNPGFTEVEYETAFAAGLLWTTF